MGRVALLDGVAILRRQALVVYSADSKVILVLDLEPDSVLAIEDAALAEKQVDLSEALVYFKVEGKLFLVPFTL